MKEVKRLTGDDDSTCPWCTDPCCPGGIGGTCTTYGKKRKD